jgi:hypothetical protein
MVIAENQHQYVFRVVVVIFGLITYMGIVLITVDSPVKLSGIVRVDHLVMSTLLDQPGQVV